MLSIKRGQAAMEYLMSYGFAFLIVLVAIGAIYTFGPSFVKWSDTCIIYGNFRCVDMTVNASRLTIKLTQASGTGFTGVGVTVTSLDCQAGNLTHVTGTIPMTWNSRQHVDLGFDCPSNNYEGNFEADVMINYSMGTATLVNFGEIRAHISS